MSLSFPYESSLNLNYTYRQIGIFQLIWYIGIGAIIALILLIMAFICRKATLKAQQIRVLNLQQSQSAFQRQDSQMNANSNQNQPWFKAIRIFNLAITLLVFSLSVTISLIFWSYYIFGTFGRSLYVDISTVFIMFMIVLLSVFIWKFISKKQEICQQKFQRIFIIIALIIWLVICIVIVIFGKGVCKCFHNDNYDQISTQYTRSRQIQKVCPSGTICHFYATLPEQTSTSVFFNVHTATDISQINLELYQNTILVQNITNKQIISFDIEDVGKRNIFTILIQNLVAKTIYQIKIFYKQNLLKHTRYRTLPAYGQNLNIISGGDLAMTQNGKKVASNIQYLDPDVIILGGDTVYDNGYQTCYYSWDNFYWMFEDVFQKKNRIIPLILSVGNHDIGYDAFTIGKISRLFEDIPLFILFNPQHKNKEGNGIAHYSERLTHHYHLIGNFILFCLDSGYLTSNQQQVKFMKQIINRYSAVNIYKYMASYHNPIYPACLDKNSDSNDMIVIKNGMKCFVPVFDEYNFVIVMEHHTHFRKVTHKIKNNIVNQNGTRYIGDGSWGVPQFRCPQQNLPQNYALFQSLPVFTPNHFWKIAIQPNNAINNKTIITYVAFNLKFFIVNYIIDQIF